MAAPIAPKVGAKVAAGHGAAGWIAGHKVVLVVGGLAGAAALYMKQRSAGASGGGATSTAGTDTSTPVGAATYDSTAQDVYSSLEPQLESLQSQITSASAQGPATTVAGPAVGTAAFGQNVFNVDSAYASSLGITPSAAPTDLATYGATRNAQNLFAVNNQNTPNAKVPGGNFTVAQTLAEAQAFQSGALGATV
jgi:hypothetical protein